MDGDQENVAQRFVGDLRELRQRAGRPSYSTLERLSGHQLRRATMSDVLNENRVNLPDWRFVAAFVEACRAAAIENQLDATELGTVADWKRHWDSASSGVIGARFPGRGRSPATRENLVQAPSDPYANLTGTDRQAGVVTPRSDRPMPPIWGMVPPRLPDFVGREGWLTRVHDQLATEPRRVVTIQGMSGIGKTQLAVEYAHRYAHEYDLVWWISCHDQQAAHISMASLAARTGVVSDEEGSGEARWNGLFDALRRGEPHKRWLLIFDNANQPDEIEDFIPPLSGHVLTTSRNIRWDATSDLLELDVFERGESVEFQRRRARKFNVTDAHRLADAVGDLPILLEHFAESQMAVDQYIALLEHDPLGTLDGQPSDYQGTITDEWQRVLGQLRDESPDSLDLLACLCFFNDGPIAQESLERGSYLPDVSIHGVLRGLSRTRAIMMLRRVGLLRVRTQTNTLEVHHATRYIVRAIISGEGTGDADRSRHDVHLLLAAADPLDPEDPANWPAYDELRGHMAQSQILACRDGSVRRLIVNLARYLSAIGDPHTALSLADDALPRWTEDAATCTPDEADACLTMQQAKAVALMATCRAEEAYQLQQETLAAMRSDPRKWETEIVLLNRLTGSHDRMTGNFRDAQVADQQSAYAHESEFGHDHPHVFPALNSVITNLVLNGSCSDAARTAQHVYSDCLAFYNDDGYPTVLFQRNIVGRCLWLGGRYDEANKLLVEVHAGYGTAVRAGTFDENHPWRLAHETDYAIVRRDVGLKPADIPILIKDLHDIRRRCWRKLGADHPQTLAVTVILGGVLGRVRGQESEAVRLLEDVQRRYQSALPDHPYGHACIGLMAAVRCRTASEGSQRAAADIQEAVERLTGLVGADHPLTLTTVGALANALARAGELDTARKRGQEAAAGFQGRFGIDHPRTLAFEANIATIQSRMGHEPASAELHARYAAILGPGHPDLALFTQGHLIDVDFTPLPL